MAGVRVEFDDAAFDDLDDAVMLDLHARGERVLADAKSRVPVQSGKLRDSLRVEDNPADHEVRIVAGEYYGLFVEVGVRGHAGKPFLRPALDAAGD